MLENTEQRGLRQVIQLCADKEAMRYLLPTDIYKKARQRTLVLLYFL